MTSVPDGCVRVPYSRSFSNSRSTGGAGGATATAGAGCAAGGGVAGTARVSAAGVADDADAADARADDTTGTFAFDAAGAACVRACCASGSRAGLAGAGAGLPWTGGPFGIEPISSLSGSGAGEGATGALTTTASVGDAGSAFVGPAEGGASKSPENRAAATTEPATAKLHPRTARARRFPFAFAGASGEDDCGSGPSFAGRAGGDSGDGPSDTGPPVTIVHEFT